MTRQSVLLFLFATAAGLMALLSSRPMWEWLVVGMSLFLALEIWTEQTAELKLRRRIKRVQQGLCPCCGYDVRASRHRCPECGEAVRTLPSVNK